MRGGKSGSGGVVGAGSGGKKRPKSAPKRPPKGDAYETPDEDGHVDDYSEEVGRKTFYSSNLHALAH